eukprot:UN22910
MKGRRKSNDVCAILIFTDGQANEGVTNTKDILAAALKATAPTIKPIKHSDPEKWTVDEVCTWLVHVGLDQYVDIFKQNKVDGQILCQDLDCDILKDDLGGMYFFMENEESIKEGFANCLGGLISVVAQDICVKFTPK